MNVRDEGVEDESTGWAWEFDPSAAWVLGEMKEPDQEAVRVMASALADLAAAGLTPDGLLADDPNPFLLRTYSSGLMLLWYQLDPHRKRVYIPRINL